MLSISTIPEALAELAKLTGREWTDSELFDVAVTRELKLQAAPPITAQSTIQEFVIGEGLREKFRSGPGHDSLAMLYPFQVAQLWISGETVTVHPLGCARGEYHWFTEPVRVTREQVRIVAPTLEKIATVWKKAQAGRWIPDREKPGGMYCQRGPEWLFPTEQPAPAQDTATPAPVVPDGASDDVDSAKDGPLPLTTGDIAFSFNGLHWTEQEWKKPLGDKPKWLKSCIAIPGARGAIETRWNPVLVGAALVQQGHATTRNVRAKFQTVNVLKPWLEAWKTYEADNFDSN